MSTGKHHTFRPQPFHAPESQQEWELSARQLLDEGQSFLACNLAKSGLQRYPNSRSLMQSVALALIRVGALEEARRLLEPFCPNLQREPERLQAVYRALQNVLPSVMNASSRPEDPQTLAKMDAFVSTLEQLLDSPEKRELPDEETLGMLAKVYKDLWQQNGDLDLARRSRDLYRLSYQTTGGYYSGINAAAMSFLTGEVEAAQVLARTVYQACRNLLMAEGEDYWLLAAMGEAHLLLGEEAEAVEKYQKAMRFAGSRYAWTVSSLQQLRLLQEKGVSIPEALFTLFTPPKVVVFVGHMIDAPGRSDARFPVALEMPVRAAIDQELDSLDVRIGYSSAACGSDILFIEAMLARGAEVNIILPFAEEDFVRKSVAFAGERWVIRYRNALKLAHSVAFVTEEPLLGDTVLFDLLARVFHGYAELRARALLTEPHLLAVWDGKPSGLVGGTADFVARWPDAESRSIVRIDALRTASGPVSVASPRVPAIPAAPSVKDSPYHGQRRIRTMLFADVVGYSKLDEARIPAFLYEFWSKVAGRLSPEPLFINTWGDAIFAVMDSALPMMEYALSLQAAVKQTEWDGAGVAEAIDVRIGLHVGPIFEATDPISHRQNYFGSHVNRAARLEPVTVPGHIYATEQFVALLMAEMSRRRVEAKREGKPIAFPFNCEYVGILSLAKNFGEQAAYHIRRASRFDNEA